jgi:preprotein translocase subunit SecG
MKKFIGITIVAFLAGCGSMGMQSGSSGSGSSAGGTSQSDNFGQYHGVPEAPFYSWTN